VAPNVRDTTDDGVGAVYQPHLVSVLDQATGAVLGQVQVDAKGSEIDAFTTLLDELDLDGVLATADALHTHRGHACYLRERGGHYLMTVKGEPVRHEALCHIPAGSGTDSKGGLLGPMAYLDPKGEGDRSMPGNRRPGSGA
jgi:hypothetical protein